MRLSRLLVIALAVIFLATGLCVLLGCGGNREAKSKVDEAVETVGSARPLLEDLIGLDERLNTLGTRFTNVEDTIAEGKSLAAMALLDVDELEARYQQARDLLLEVTGMEGAGSYAEYARLALVAVNIELEVMAVNRQLLTDVQDMLDVLPLAESQEQLSYYTQEIEALTAEIADLLQQGAEAAQQADRYYEEHGL
ncbi:MAG: hypothetical protein JW854_13380 [Actinobacteria bacterium]|nr:hypothetical protein [Actinomycetota bacterium]